MQWAASKKHGRAVTAAAGRTGRIAVVLGLVLAFVVVARAHAQASFDGESVVSLRFEGVRSVSEDDLREAIATRARECRTFLYAPLCLVTDAGLFHDDYELDTQELIRDVLRIRVYYWRAGYRTAAAEPVVEEDGGGVAVTFVVAEGPPTIVDTVLVTQADSVLSRSDLARVGLPRARRPLDVNALDSATVRLRMLLRERGYADAQVTDTTLVTEDGLGATVQVRVEPGRVATIGPLEVTGNEEVSDRTILRLLDLNEGQVFRSSDLLEAQRRLYRSELFRQAIMRAPETADSTKPLVVSVREAPFRAVRLGVGITTTEFVQAEVAYTLYNWYGTARRLDLRGAVGNLLAPELHGRSIFDGAAPAGIDMFDDAFLRPTWQLSAEVSQPWLFSRRHSVSVSAFGHRRSVPGVVIDEGFGAAATLTRRIHDDISASLGYRYERVRIEAGDLYFCAGFGVCGASMIQALSGSQTLSPALFTIRADRSDDPLAPTRGWTGSITAEFASAAIGSDYRYARYTGEFTHYRPVGPGVLALRVRGGRVHALSGTAAAVGAPDAGTELVHPRKRFYAGGSRSVRGFAENQLGPRILTVDPRALTDTLAAACIPGEIGDGSCDPAAVAADQFTPRPLGGNSLIEGTVEYRIPLGGTFVAAVFVDAATVGSAGLDVPPGVRRAVTPGAGIRYVSPIGPVRIDLGVRSGLRELLPVVTQAEGEDGELRLVRLEQRKLYDPTDASGGFFADLVSRLQLHLSIGEAF